MKTKRLRRERRQRILREKVLSGRISKENNKLKKLITGLFFVGLFLQIWEIFIYRQTIIDLKIPLTIWLAPGLILTPILYKKLNDIGGEAHWALHYVLHTCMTGGILIFSFMATNYYFADKKVTTREFRVIETGHLKRRPYIIINYDGFEKQLVFPKYGNIDVLSAQHVEVKIREGLLGFDILDEYEID